LLEDFHVVGLNLLDLVVLSGEWSDPWSSPISYPSPISPISRPNLQQGHSGRHQEAKARMLQICIWVIQKNLTLWVPSNLRFSCKVLTAAACDTRFQILNMNDLRVSFH
jgi:hypothetical protein